MALLMGGGDASKVISLSPERVHSFQLSFAGNNWAKGLNFEINGFYNRATDLIMTHVVAYKNASQNKTGGVELMASYRSPQTVSAPGKLGVGKPKFTTDFNLTWTRTFKSNLMGVELGDGYHEYNKTDIDANNNTPSIMSNLVFGWQAMPRLKLHTHVMFESKQYSYNTDLVKLVQLQGLITQAKYAYNQNNLADAQALGSQALEMVGDLIMCKEMPARAIVSLRGEYNFGSVSLGLNVHNLLNTRYYRSGMNTNIIPQQGRWFMASVGVRL
jgi:iron complex outermembrane receptor protein